MQQQQKQEEREKEREAETETANTRGSRQTTTSTRVALQRSLFTCRHPQPHDTSAHQHTHANTHIHTHMLSSTGDIASAAAATGVWHQGSLLNCLLATLWISIQLFAQLNQRTQPFLSLHLCPEAVFAARHGKKNLMPKRFIDSQGERISLGLWFQFGFGLR